MQQKRIDNINTVETSNKKYFRRVRIHDYLPAQVTYSLGEYPAYVSAKPTEYDKALLTKMAQRGVELIQVHEEWNDAVRLYGADKFNAPDKEGMKEFVDLCHSLGIKVIAYVSSGYFQETDPDWREEFARYDKVFACNYFKYRKGCHGSAPWREYIIPKTFYVMDEYGFDGIFNDWGYDNTHGGADGGLPEYDPELEDLLSIIYSGIKKRGGIYKIHCDRNNAPPVRDRVYDYLWIGEWVENSPVGVGKDYPTYVVPCLDRHRSDKVDQKTHFAYTIPFLQFPLLKHGRPLLGNNVDLPGVTYYGGDEQEFFKNVKEYMKTHKNGPFVYSLWSSIPDDPTEFDVWSKYLALYKPMVSENSLAYIDVKSSDFFKEDIAQDVYASVFVNEEIYLVVSNLSQNNYVLKLNDAWVDRQTNKSAHEFELAPEQMIFLRKV